VEVWTIAGRISLVKIEERTLYDLTTSSPCHRSNEFKCFSRELLNHSVISKTAIVIHHTVLIKYRNGKGRRIEYGSTQAPLSSQAGMRLKLIILAAAQVAQSYTIRKRITKCKTRTKGETPSVGKSEESKKPEALESQIQKSTTPDALETQIQESTTPQ
jgi:hypothetical protein